MWLEHHKDGREKTRGGWGSQQKLCRTCRTVGHGEELKFHSRCNKKLLNHVAAKDTFLCLHFMFLSLHLKCDCYVKDLKYQYLANTELNSKCIELNCMYIRLQIIH